MTQRPKSISGFPEWLPQQRVVELKLLDIIRSNFERFGFCPIETPAAERKEALKKKGGNEKEIYGLTRLSQESDEKDLGLHFDLTVPVARYVAQHYEKLTFPFRRYQIQKVWRGERPQSGRFREFYQCDVDIIGDGELSLLADAEIPSVICRIFDEMKIGPFLIRINNWKILAGYLMSIGVPENHLNDTFRAVDDLEKRGVGQFITTLASFGISEAKARKIIAFANPSGTNEDILSALRSSTKVNDVFQRGMEELETVIGHMTTVGIPGNHFRVSPGLARGLDYYTGTVYETILVNHPGIGSICSGGRYDDLASSFIEKKLPGVGISIGLTRLFDRLVKAELVTIGPATSAPVLVTTLDPSRMREYFEISARIRNAGINTEVFLEPKKIGAQLKYASKKGFTLAVIIGSEEFATGKVKIKNLRTGEETTAMDIEICNKIREGLGIPY